MYRYKFELKTALMYNQDLKIIDGTNIYEAIAEYAPRKESTLLVWLDDFNIPSNKIDSIKDELELWLSSKNILVFFESGNTIR